MNIFKIFKIASGLELDIVDDPKIININTCLASLQKSISVLRDFKNLIEQLWDAPENLVNDVILTINKNIKPLYYYDNLEQTLNNFSKTINMFSDFDFYNSFIIKKITSLDNLEKLLDNLSKDDILNKLLQSVNLPYKQLITFRDFLYQIGGLNIIEDFYEFKENMMEIINLLNNSDFIIIHSNTLKKDLQEFYNKNKFYIKKEYLAIK